MKSSTAAVSEAIIGRIMHQLVTALAGLHDRGIIHRDVKPGAPHSESRAHKQANILIRGEKADPDVALADLGNGTSIAEKAS